MGKKYQLSTPKLRDDYRTAAKLLRKFAHVRKRNNEMFVKILGSKHAHDHIVNLIAAERAQCFRIAKRFADRARRMNVNS